MSKGIFTISIDTELAWGTYDHGGHVRFKGAYDQYRSIIYRLLYLFKKYDISSTWAIVGHLFLDKCECHPGMNIGQDPHWYGSDMVELIQKASPQQEIASHSFLHRVFPHSSKEVIQSDLQKSIALAKEKGIILKSFVFPRNRIDHLDLLYQHGFKAYRYHPQTSSTFFRRGINLLKDMVPITPPRVHVFCDFETPMIAVPSGFHFRYAYGWSRWMIPSIRSLKAKKGLKKAAQEKSLFHIWFHPIDFAWKGQRMFLEFEEVLKMACSLRKESKLDILPMGEIKPWDY